MHTASVRKINRKNASSPTYIEVGPSAPPTIEIAGILSNKLKTVVACSGMRPMFNISAIINSVFRTLLFILCNFRGSTAPYTPAAFSSAICQQSPSPISKSNWQAVTMVTFSPLFRYGKGRALSRTTQGSFFKRHDEYTSRINVYTHHNRSENQQKKPALPNINGSWPVRTAYDCNCKRTI